MRSGSATFREGVGEADALRHNDRRKASLSRDGQKCPFKAFKGLLNIGVLETTK